MVEELKIAIDLGSYSTKSKNLTTGEYSELPNNIIEVEDDVNSEQIVFSENLEDSLDVVFMDTQGKLEGVNLGRRYFVGGLANQYSASCVKPNSLMSKTYQTTTYVNLLTNIALEMVKNDIDYAEPVLGTLLPPIEVYGKDKEVFLHNICRRFRIGLPLLNKNLTINIKPENVKLVAECFASFTPLLYDENGNLTDIAKKFSSGMLIAIDIGASTTDLAAVNNLKPLARTFDTMRIGGNKVVSLLIDEIKHEMSGYRPGFIEAEEALKTGYLYIGSEPVDVRQHIANAKKKFADIFYEYFIEYMESKSLHVYGLRGMVFTGGGSIKTDSIDSVGAYILNRVKAISPYTEALFIPNPRYSNLEGVSMYLAVTD